MDKVVEYSSESPYKAIVYMLVVAVAGLCSVVVVLWKDNKKEEVKNFNMLLRAIEAFKENGEELDSVKNNLVLEFSKLNSKVNQLLGRVNKD